MRNFIGLFFLILFFPSEMFGEKTSSEASKNILIINSYHIGYQWSDEMIKGVSSTLDSASNVFYYTEFMDSKRFLSYELFSYFYSYLNSKYSAIPFDLLIVTDNNALDFVLQYEDSTLFKEKPTVFAGITNVGDYDFEKKDVYGIVEEHGLSKVFYSMTKMFPSRKNIHVILDKSYTSSIYKDILKDYAQSHDSHKIIVVSHLNSESITEYASKLSDNDILFFLDCNVDAENRIINNYTLVKSIVESTDIPIYSQLIAQMDGIFCGEINNGIEHGDVIGKMAIQLLNGEQPDPKIIHPNPALYFNHHELEKYNIDDELLPRGAVIYNAPVSIFKKIKNSTKWIHYLIAIFIIGLIFLMITLFRMRKQKQLLFIEKEHAVRSENMKSSFLAHISHEFRTPLNAILGFSDILKIENDDPDLINHIDQICGSSEMLVKLINDILDLSLIDAKEIKLSERKIYLPDFFETLLQRNQFAINHLQKENLDICYNIPNTAPYYIFTDEIRLNQILQNLISNAVKYSAQGQIAFNYSIVNKEDIIKSKNKDLQKYPFVHDQYFRFQIEDQGIGIMNNQIPLIFNRFRALDQKYISDESGVGLGLFITKSLINIMGGEIWVESEVSVGTRFSFILPCQPDFS
ncbi:HAMP domain-containing histidine kinase [bacterium]|nr:HAMP domain-containing histidine kinase [bacterium]